MQTDLLKNISNFKSYNKFLPFLGLNNGKIVGIGTTSNPIRLSQKNRNGAVGDY